jgi:hypothetical protein
MALDTLPGGVLDGDCLEGHWMETAWRGIGWTRGVESCEDQGTNAGAALIEQGPDPGVAIRVLPRWILACLPHKTRDNP